jgi:hypothetical protein
VKRELNEDCGETVKKEGPDKVVEAKLPDFAKSGWQAGALRLSDHFR